VTVRSGQFDRQGNAVTIANQVAITAPLSPICRIWPRQQPPKTARTEQLSATARDESISAITGKPVQQCEMDQIPNSVLLPVSQPSPAGHARAATQCFRQHPAGNAITKHENNAREASPVCQARSPTLRLGRRNWQKRFDQIPQRIRNERASHVKVPPNSNRMPELLPLY
jgi:hypothetical protein